MNVPKPRKLSSGNYFIQLRLNGQSVPVTAPTKKECTDKARLIKSGYKVDGKIKKAAGITLHQAIDKYIASRSNTLSPSTIRNYTMVQKHRFADVMDKPIKSIKDWQYICNNESRKCSAKTLRNAWMFLVSVLREQGFEVHKISLPQIVKGDPVFLEPEQISIFVDAIKGKYCEIPALLALHSCRRSEIWGDLEIDLKIKIIKVKGAMVLNKDNKLEKKLTNKNQQSRRDISIMIPELITAVEKKIKEKKPILPQDQGHVYDQINAICRDNGLPEVGLHGLRHTFVSLAYHLQISEMYVMQTGGWSDYGTMRKIYTHFAKQDAIKSQNKMHEFFSKP